jgi:hypothetical protein
VLCVVLFLIGEDMPLNLFQFLSTPDKIEKKKIMWLMVGDVFIHSPQQ